MQRGRREVVPVVVILFAAHRLPNRLLVNLTYLKRCGGVAVLLKNVILDEEPRTSFAPIADTPTEAPWFKFTGGGRSAILRINCPRISSARAADVLL